jgi:hypothetical protein
MTTHHFDEDTMTEITEDAVMTATENWHLEYEGEQELFEYVYSLTGYTWNTPDFWHWALTGVTPFAKS